MTALALQFVHGGIHLSQLGLWLDAHRAQSGPERVFVSHAHSDHTAPHREVILSAPTARLMQARIGGERVEHLLPFDHPRGFDHGGIPFQLTLLPAGHIFGSAMAWIAVEGESMLYTGDFKLRPSLSAEPCEPRHADVLIMETTFGRPQYRFPATADVMRGVIRFCREALDHDETAVLFGYSLGKSQEVLCGLADAGLPIMLHGAVQKMTRVYEQFGHRFPQYEPYDVETAKGKVLLGPPSLAGAHALRKLGRLRTAVLTGWAVEPNCRYRYQTDAAFPLSDHADFPDLIEFVKRVAPRKVYTLHGFAADFAQTLRELGFDAQALGEDEQMMLDLRVESALLSPAPELERRSPTRRDPRQKRAGSETSAPVETRSFQPSTSSFATFLAFSQACAAIATITSKPQKVRLLASYLQTLDKENVTRAATWFVGPHVAVSDNKVPQLGWALLRDALCAVAELSRVEVYHIYLKHSDLGETAFEVLQHRQVRLPALTLVEADSLFREIAAATGPGAKLPLLSQALERCAGLEAKFLVKILTSGLRIGLKEALVEEAIAQAFARPGAAGQPHPGRHR